MKPEVETMMPKVLKTVGYVTAMVGKWGQLPLGPAEFGFDDYLRFKGSGVEKTVACIEKAAFTGEVGDGMIFTYNIEESVRISNGARGEASTAGPGDLS